MVFSSLVRLPEVKAETQRLKTWSTSPGFRILFFLNSFHGWRLLLVHVFQNDVQYYKAICIIPCYIIAQFTQAHFLCHVRVS